MLLTAVLFLACQCAMIGDIWVINHPVAIVVLVSTTVGLLAYFLTIGFATFSYECPFQTHFSRSLRYIFTHPRSIQLARSAFDLLRWGYLWVQSEAAEEDVERQNQTPDVPHHDPQPRPQEPSLEHQASIASCISWILESSTEPEVTLSAISYIK